MKDIFDDFGIIGEDITDELVYFRTDNSNLREFPLNVIFTSGKINGKLYYYPTDLDEFTCCLKNLDPEKLENEQLTQKIINKMLELALKSPIMGSYYAQAEIDTFKDNCNKIVKERTKKEISERD